MLLEIKIYRKNLIKGMNTYAVTPYTILEHT